MTKDPIDVLVGQKVRDRRRELKMSQTDLASKVGLSFQQLQKYEKAINRISASKLWNISKVIDVPVSYFFEGAE